MSKEEQLFKALDVVFLDYNYNISDADRFALLLKYQQLHLSKISDNNNTKATMALSRTSMYEITDAIKRWKRNKSKNQLFKLVNLFSIACESYDFDVWSGELKYVWQILLTNKSSIIENESWYIRTIPESLWIIEYLKETYE